VFASIQVAQAQVRKQERGASLGMTLNSFEFLVLSFELEEPSTVPFDPSAVSSGQSNCFGSRRFGAGQFVRGNSILFVNGKY